MCIDVLILHYRIYLLFVEIIKIKAMNVILLIYICEMFVCLSVHANEKFFIKFPKVFKFLNDPIKSF